MGELHQIQVERDLRDKELSNLRRQLLLVQRAYLMQQRELNTLQMEKVEAALNRKDES